MQIQTEGKSSKKKKDFEDIIVKDTDAATKISLNYIRNRRPAWEAVGL